MSLAKTNLETLNTDTLPEIQFSAEIKLQDVIFDFSFSEEERIFALNKYNKETPDNILEIITKLGTMYELSGTTLLKNFLFAICKQSELSAFLKSFCTKALYSYDSKNDIGYLAISVIYEELYKDPLVGTPYKIDLLKILMLNEAYNECTKEFFIRMINDPVLNCNYRYKIILGLEVENMEDILKKDNSEKIDVNTKKKLSFFIREGSFAFLFNEKNEISYRILAAQNLLKSFELSHNETEKIEKILLSIGKDEKVEYNLRADATDILLSSKNEEMKGEAKVIIASLGRNENALDMANIYENKQNVHTKELEEKVMEIITFLEKVEIQKIKGKSITVKYVEKQINIIMRKFKTSTEDKEKIQISLDRIVMDRALYSKFNFTLKNILLRIWTYIVGHEHILEMQKRLLQELSEMSGTCSTGFASRLVNTISGFGEFNLAISFKDQIIANFTGRLNARIRLMDDLTMQEKIMSELSNDSKNYDQRRHFLKFLRKNMLGIREEMQEEFKPYITDQEFDLYFRAAVSKYETGS